MACYNISDGQNIAVFPCNFFINFFFEHPKKKLQKERVRQVKKSLSMTLIPAKRQNSFGYASLKQLPFLTPEFHYG